MTTESQLVSMTMDQLRARLRYVEDRWQEAVNKLDGLSKMVKRHNSNPQAHRIPPRPKKKYRLDKTSGKHILRDGGPVVAISSSAIAIAVYKQLASKVESGEIDVLVLTNALMAVLKEPWAVAIILLVGGYVIWVTALKALQEFE